MDRALTVGAANSPTGTYIGTGVGMSIILGYRPKLVKIYRTDRVYSVQRSDLAEDITAGQIALGTGKNYRTVEVPDGEGIIIDSEGFSVGVSVAVNEPGFNYIWEAI